MKTKNLSKVLVCLGLGSVLALQTSAGTLTGTQGTAPSTVNLTLEGTLDWAHWGLTSPTDFNQKAGGTNQISNFTSIGDGTVEFFDDAATAYWWDDGAPTPSAAFLPSGIYVGGLSNGFEFTVTADTTVKELKVYAGAWNARVRFEASLSDGSAPPYIDESFNDTGIGGVAVYTVTFVANSAGQSLTVRIYSSELNDPGGNCTLMAATLRTPATEGNGTLSARGSFLANDAVVDLTGEGILDWAHWGLASETDFNHKQGVTQRISNFTLIGSGTPTVASLNATTYTWTDGTPTTTASNTSSVYVSGEGNGFQFTVPADTSTNVLRVYVNAQSARVRLEASLSDNSAAALSDDSYETDVNRIGPVRVYAITFAAGSPGQTLTVKCTIAADEGAGSISLQAATLRAAPAQTGVLGGAFSDVATASNVNLTEEGRIDWAHWGLTSGEDVDRKIGGTNVIGDFSVIGMGDDGLPPMILNFPDNFTEFSWTDGTPNQTATRSPTGIYLVRSDESAGLGINGGFEVSVPADTTVRTFKVFLGAYAARMHFEAFLSDHSAPPYVDESFYNESDGPNRVYTLTYAAASAGQTLTVRYWTLDLADETWGNVTLLAAVTREAAPVVNLTGPNNTAIFYPAQNGLRFTATTINPFSIEANQLGLELNGVDVSSDLTVTGTDTARTGMYTNLAPNRFYTGHIWAIDNEGNGSTNAITFDTFSTNGAVVIELEDYNYTIDAASGGKFIDNPVPGAYANLIGLSETDYHTAVPVGNEYRPSDGVGIVDAVESRSYFGSVPNYAVTEWNVDDWMNYSRTFPEGNYQVYLRFGSGSDQSLAFGLVTGDPTQPNQQVTPIGVLNAPGISLGTLIYRYTTLTDTNGAPITVPLSGVETLRLTGVNVDPGDLEADFMVLVPAAASEQPRLSVKTSGSQVQISFPTQSGSSYTLQYKGSLADTTWTDILPSISGDGSVKTVSQEIVPPSRFYRLSVE